MQDVWSIYRYFGIIAFILLCDLKNISYINLPYFFILSNVDMIAWEMKA